MHVSIFLEHQKDNGYRATSLGPTRIVAEGATREEALARLRQLLCEQFVGGEIVQIDVPLPIEPNPWLAIAGAWKDHPELDEFVENIREYRRQVDTDPDRP